MSENQSNESCTGELSEHNQAILSKVPKSVRLKYVNGETKNYFCFANFNLGGGFESVPEDAAKELLTKIHDGRPMFVQV